MASIYAGGKPIKGLGPLQFRMLEFALRNPGWHSYSDTHTTRRVVASLVRRGVIEHSPETKQFRFNQAKG